MGNLTQRQCQTTLCPSGKAMVNHYDGDGLYLRVTKKGNKSWLFFYTHNKKRNMMSIGPYPSPYALIEARSERDNLKNILAEGKNPKIVRDMQKAEVVGESLKTIEHIYKAVKKERMNSQVKAWSKGHIKRTEFTWKHLKPLANVPITKLTKKRLRKLLVSINQNIGRSTGEKAKALLSVIYSHALANNIVYKNLVGDFASDLELQKRNSVDIESHSGIPTDRLGETFTLINNSKMSHITKYALLCIQYTSLRVSSLLASRWEDYDKTKEVLYIHKEFVKNRKAMNCPVINEMASMFDSLEKIQQSTNLKWNKKCFIFSIDGLEPLGIESPNNALKKLLLKHKLGFNAKPYGFRTTCEIAWTKKKFLTTAINVQQDHKSTTGDVIKDRYISEGETFLSERKEMLEFMAKKIKDAMDDYDPDFDNWLNES